MQVAKFTFNTHIIIYKQRTTKCAPHKCMHFPRRHNIKSSGRNALAFPPEAL